MTFQNFVVLGIIPGTNYQISFYGWLLIVLTMLVSVPLYFALRNQVRVMLAVLNLNAALNTQQHISDITI